MNFSDAAVRLAGLAGWLLHWPPDAFWCATPVELAAIFTAMAGQGAGLDGVAAPPDRQTLDRLKEMYPDG